MTAPKKPLAPGERVAVYTGGGRQVGVVVAPPSGWDEPDMISVKVDGARDGKWAHPKQCRRLVKRERRRVWFERTLQGEGYSNVDDMWKQIKPGERIEFVEARKERK